MFDKKLGEISIKFTKINDVDIGGNDIVPPEKMSFIEMLKIFRHMSKLYVCAEEGYRVGGESSGWESATYMFGCKLAVIIKAGEDFTMVFADNIEIALICFDNMIMNRKFRKCRIVYGILHSSEEVIDFEAAKASSEYVGTYLM